MVAISQQIAAVILQSERSLFSKRKQSRCETTSIHTLTFATHREEQTCDTKLKIQITPSGFY